MGCASSHTSVAHAHDDGLLLDGNFGVIDVEHDNHAMGIFDEGSGCIYARSHRVYRYRW